MARRRIVERVLRILEAPGLRKPKPPTCPFCGELLQPWEMRQRHRSGAAVFKVYVACERCAFDLDGPADRPPAQFYH